MTRDPQYRAPLTAGEVAVRDVLDAQLADVWEIYEQPHLNGRRPDVVALAPGIGIVFIEVKDGAPDRRPAVRRRAEKCAIEETVRARSRLITVTPSLTAREAGEVPCAVVFTHPDWNPTAEPPRGVTVCAGGSWPEQLLRVFAVVEQFRRTTRVTTDIADDVRHWLVQPEFDREQWSPITLTERQREIADNPDGVRRRRVRGVGGSGKTEALVARAARARAQGAERVLVVCFNLTLVTYLRDRVRAHERFEGVDPGGVTILHWHGWAKEMMLAATGDGWAWGALFAESDLDATGKMIEAGDEVAAAIRAMPDELRDRYDVIIIDEGQDIPPACVRALAEVLTPDGELLLAGDRAQNLYARADDWTTAAYEGLGFNRWMELKGSQRVPLALATIIAEIDARQNGGDPIRWIPEAQQVALPTFEPVIRWEQVSPERLVDAAFEAAIALIPASREQDQVAAWADLVVIASGVDLVGAIASRFRQRGYAVVDTFDSRDDRGKKARFYKGHAAVKITTIHSIKGFSVTRAVVVFADGLTERSNWGNQVITALSRLTGRESGCAMTIVCADENLRDIGGVVNRLA